MDNMIDNRSLLGATVTGFSAWGNLQQIYFKLPDGRRVVIRAEAEDRQDKRRKPEAWLVIEPTK